MSSLVPLVLSLAPGLATSQTERPWFSEVIMTAPAKLGGCAVGDLDPDHPGDEVASVCENGQVFLSFGTAAGPWISAVIAELPGEPIQCAIGDAYPERPGHELLVVGMMAGKEGDGGMGAAYVISRVEGRWTAELVYEDTALIHAGTIADVVVDRAGAEIVVAGFSKHARVLSFDAGADEAGWQVVASSPLPGPAKSLVPFARGVAVACADGSLIYLEHGTVSDELDRAPAGQARLGVAGERLIVARDDGKLALVDARGERVEIHSAAGKLRGAVLADLDPEHPGLEAATAGYDRKLTVLYEDDGRWSARTIYTDTDRFHHLAAGELDAESPGLELVACGYSGRLILAGVERRQGQ